MLTFSLTPTASLRIKKFPGKITPEEDRFHAIGWEYFFTSIAHGIDMLIFRPVQLLQALQLPHVPIPVSNQTGHHKRKEQQNQEHHQTAHLLVHGPEM
jgi:hypothetical protein